MAPPNRSALPSRVSRTTPILDPRGRITADNAGAAERLLTASEFATLRTGDAYRYELVRGRVVREPPPLPEHGRIDVRLGARLHEHVERTGAGVVLANTGFVIEVDPDTVRGPDLAFVASGRVPGYTGSYWRMAPDLAIEIVSPSNGAAEIRRKVREYLAAGSRLVWVVDARRRTVAVHRSPSDVRLLAAGDELGGDDVLPGFLLPLSDLFG